MTRIILFPPQGPRRARRAPPGPTAARPVRAAARHSRLFATCVEQRVAVSGCVIIQRFEPVLMLKIETRERWRGGGGGDWERHRVRGGREAGQLRREGEEEEKENTHSREIEVCVSATRRLERDRPILAGETTVRGGYSSSEFEEEGTRDVEWNFVDMPSHDAS
jgi:hypothetical protein